MKRVESNTYPLQTESLQGVLLVNYDVQEVVKVDENNEPQVSYNYGQSRLQQDAPMSDVLKEVEKGTAYWVKFRKDLALDTLKVVSTDNVPFDANNTSINYMNAVLNIANFKMIKTVAEGGSIPDMYDTIYLTELPWRNADNTVSTVQLKTIAEALEKSMTSVGVIKTESDNYTLPL